MAKPQLVVPAVLVAILAFMLVILYLSTGNYGECDSVNHYLISRYSLKHTSLLLDHWGKPFFTLLSAPFSQIGYTGIKLFNILTGLSAAYISFLIAKKLNIKNAWLAIVFAISAPVYFIYLYTGLTEPLFSLMLILSTYLFIDRKYLFAILLVSFTPFVRNEGLLIIAIFFVTLVIYRRYKYIPLLATGSVIYSIAGIFVYDDFLWLLNRLPYNLTNSIYGSGDFWVYFDRTKIIYGYPLAVLTLIGLGYAIRQYIKEKRMVFNSSWFYVLYFVFGISIILVLFHSFLWWQGLMAVYAQERFIASIIPLVAILGLLGYNWLEQQVTRYIKWRYIQKIAILIVVGILVHQPFRHYTIPFKLDNEQVVVKAAADWILQSNYNDEFIFYFSPMVPYFLMLDPYDNDRCHKGLHNTEKPHEWVSDGALIIWDGHYGVERGYPIKSLIDNSYLELISAFKPEKPFSMMGEEYGVYIFRKSDR